MKETFIRHGTQHEVRVTEITRRGLKKLGFKLQQRRSLTEPLIILEESGQHKKLLREIGIGQGAIVVAVERALSRGDYDIVLFHFLKQCTGSSIEKGKPFHIPNSVEIVVNKVEKDGKTTYEIDLFQQPGDYGFVSIVRVLEQK